MNTSLVIMAAGIGSRFGGGIKQLEPVDSRGHIIMDYSVKDAINAGFNKIIFVIRRDIEDDFREIIGSRIEAVCEKLGVEVCYAFQELSDIPEGFTVPDGRIKPWGTGQAVLSARNVISEPFAVINADDYYGAKGFAMIHDYIASGGSVCMAGFVLGNTLSDNGGVTRGICKMDEEGFLSEICETGNIVKTVNGAEAGGEPVDMDSLVSMNMWGFEKAFIDKLEKGFIEFLKKGSADMTKAEFLIPVYVGELLENNEINVLVLRTDDTWYGMTYRDDVESVRRSFSELVAKGAYSEELFE